MSDTRKLPDKFEQFPYLPDEMIGEICHHLSGKDLIALRNVGKRYANIVQQHFQKPSSLFSLVELSPAIELEEFFELYPDVKNQFLQPMTLLVCLNKFTPANICKLISTAKIDGENLTLDEKAPEKELMAYYVCLALTTKNITSLDLSQLESVIAYYSREENKDYANVKNSLTAMLAILKFGNPILPSKELIPGDQYLNLSGIEFSVPGIPDLTGFDFSGLNLRNAYFWALKLVKAKFVNAILDSVTFGFTPLTGANFTDACADNVDMMCNADGALFVRTRLRHANLGSVTDAVFDAPVFFNKLDSVIEDVQFVLDGDRRLAMPHPNEIQLSSIMADEFIKKIPKWKLSDDPMIFSIVGLNLIRLLQQNFKRRTTPESVKQLISLEDEIKVSAGIEFLQQNAESLSWICEERRFKDVFAPFKHDTINYVDDEQFIKSVESLRSLFYWLSEPHSMFSQLLTFDEFREVKETITAYLDYLSSNFQRLRAIEIKNYSENNQPFTADTANRMQALNHVIKMLDEAKYDMQHSSDFTRLADALKYIQKSWYSLAGIHEKARIEPKESLLDKASGLFKRKKEVKPEGQSAEAKSPTQGGKKGNS
jgi:uncharacterized protein YjbI with pentapeptide repeats